jgi:hypothetical protein
LRLKPNKAPFKSTDFSHPSFLIAYSYFYNSARVWSFGNKPNVLGVSVQTQRSFGKKQKKKNPPWLLSISVHLCHICEYHAKLFYVWGKNYILVFSVISLFHPFCVLYSIAKSLPCLTFAARINPDLHGNSTISVKENFSSSQAYNPAMKGS